MTFRDDHDAAIARAEALERELGEKRRKREETSSKLADIERRLEEVELERERLRAAMPPSTPPPPMTLPAPRWDDPQPASSSLDGTRKRHAMLAAFMFTGLALFVITAMFVAGERRSGRVENPVCTLRTDPPGANVYSVRGGGETLIGTTPLTKDSIGWFTAEQHGARLVARKPGYVDTLVSSPWDGPGCRERVDELMTESDEH